MVRDRRANKRQVILAGGSSHIPKIATRFAQLFPDIPVHAPATDINAINPQELAARGAAIQASLVAEFDIEDIVQSTHPAVTVAPHISKAIGVAIVGEDGTEVFQSLLAAQTAIPARAIAEFDAPANGGNVIVRFVEGSSEIRKHKVVVEKEDDSEAESDDEVEEEEIKTKHQKVDRLLAEALIKDVEKGQKIEVTVNAGLDGAVQVAARIVGTQKGVRGTIAKA